MNTPETPKDRQDPTNDNESASQTRDLDFGHLFEKYYRPVAAYFKHRGVPPEDCRDLAQETFVRAYRGLDKFRGDSSRKTWLFKIARHTYLNSLRSRKTQKRDADEVSLQQSQEAGLQVATSKSPSDATQDPEENLLSEEHVTLLRDALGRLPPQMRQCLILQQQGLNYREIATLMGVSIETVKSHLHQVRRRLSGKVSESFAFAGSPVAVPSVVPGPGGTPLTSHNLSRLQVEDKLEATESARLIRIARVLAHAEDVFGSTDKARDWLASKNRALAGQKPLQLLDTDAGTQEVEDVLGRIEHGIFD